MEIKIERDLDDGYLINVNLEGWRHCKTKEIILRILEAEIEVKL